MGKHHELKEDKFMFLIELWHRERNLVIDKLETFPLEEAAQHLKEWGLDSPT